MEGRGGGGTTKYADDKNFTPANDVFCLFASHGLNMFHK